MQTHDKEFIGRRRLFDIWWKAMEAHCSPWRFLTRILPLEIRARRTCPCCGYPTLQNRYWWEICFICRWEDDGHDDADADEKSGANSPIDGPPISLSEARRNFLEHGDIYGGAKIADDLAISRQQAGELLELFNEFATACHKGNIEPTKNAEAIIIFRRIKNSWKSTTDEKDI